MLFLFIPSVAGISVPESIKLICFISITEICLVLTDWEQGLVCLGKSTFLALIYCYSVCLTCSRENFTLNSEVSFCFLCLLHPRSSVTAAWLCATSVFLKSWSFSTVGSTSCCWKSWSQPGRTSLFRGLLCTSAMLWSVRWIIITRKLWERWALSR